MNLRHYQCPLTSLIYNDPVIAEDGFIYEFRAIKNWFETCNKSPITGLQINKTLIPVHSFSAMIDEFLTEHPEYANERFICNKPVNLFNEEFMTVLENKQFNELLDFTGFNITEFIGKVTVIEYLCTFCKNDEIIKHVIDNSYDYDTVDKNKLKPIFHVLRLGSKDIIEFFIKKNIDLNELGAGSATMLHYLMKHHSYEDISDIVQYIINNSNINFSTADGSGFEPFHFLAVHGTCTELLKFVNNTHASKVTTTGMLPIHLACKFNGSKEFIKEVINKTYDNDENKTCELLIYSNEKLTVSDKRELVMFYLNMIFKKVVINDTYFE